MNIAVVGTGYVGLVSGTCLADMGNHVTCIDIDKAKVEKLKSGEITIYEEGLETLFERNLQSNRLAFTTNLADGIKDAEIIFLALPTPPNEDGSADLSFVLKVADDISYLLEDYKIIVNKSTVPVGSAEKVRDIITKNYKGEFDVVSNPEFLKEGMAVSDFLKPERVIVGTSSERAAEKMKQLFEPFVRQGNPIIIMDERSSEMTKYASNVYLASRISYMNEIANVCERVGANVDMVRQGMGSDSRIGKRFLFPGLGYGGSCFPKDVRALHNIASENNYDFKILDSVMEVNALQKDFFLQKILSYYNDDVKDKSFALWGISFKPNTDDIREAPSIYIIEQLLKRGAKLSAFDPEGMDNYKIQHGHNLGSQLELAKNMYDALDEKDALLIATEWSMFRSPDYKLMKEKMKHNVIFDGRNLYDLSIMEENQFYYNSIGRKTIK